MRLRLVDAVDLASGRRDELTPPRRLRGVVGDSDFLVTGREFGSHLRELAALKPSDRVLDIGCGVGRIARVLTKELRPPGSYDGFDVVPESIAWCRRHYREMPVPFRFVHADLYNAMYNERGVGSATEYRFPYSDASFDLVVATSVFTHLRAQAVDRYLAEVARVLAPAGRLFSTWFLLEPGRMTDHAPMIDFERTAGPEAMANPGLAEAAVAYDAAWLYNRLEAHGLEVHSPLYWGTWSGRSGKPGMSMQDIVVAHVE